MINFSQQYSPYTVQVRIRAKNTCGWSDWSPYFSLTVQDCGGGWYMVSPNPATSEVTVTASNNKTTASAKNATITEVNIYDQTGTLKKQQKFGKVKKATVNTSNLPYGIYIIEIVNGSYKERQELSIIKH